MVVGGGREEERSKEDSDSGRIRPRVETEKKREARSMPPPARFATPSHEDASAATAEAPSHIRRYHRCLGRRRAKPLPPSHEGPAYMVVPLDVAPSGVTQPLVEILWEHVPDNVIRSSRCTSPSDVVIP